MSEEREPALGAAIRKVLRAARHHKDCEPLSSEGCRCGLWDLKTAYEDDYDDDDEVDEDFED